MKDISKLKRKPLVSIDIETYSPQTPPWKNGRKDPVVAFSMASADEGEPSRGMTIITVIQPPEKEVKLLSQVARLLQYFNGTQVWYYGYGAEKFDMPYLIYRSSLYGLDKELINSVEKNPNIEVSDLAKRSFNLDPEYHLSMSNCEERLGIRRMLPKTIFNGASYHDYFDQWRGSGSPLAIWYNQEDVLCTLNILHNIIDRTQTRKDE